MSKVKLVHLNEITMNFAEDLAKILSEDIKLQKSIGSKNIKTTGSEFIDSSKKWAYDKKADMFAIILDEVAIGTISLSHQDEKIKKAQIGYWISSNFWGQGCGRQAFSHIISFAKSKNIEKVSASIKKDNIASRKIWEKCDANIEFKNNRYFASMDL